MNKNVPNIITISRVILTPIMVLLFLLPIKNGIGLFVAFAIFVIGSLTDMLDGHIARKYNLVSDLGKLLDAVADKFIQTAAMLLVLVATNLVPAWVATIVLLVAILRDVWINALRQICASKGTVVAADLLGKLKSIILDVGISILMFYFGLVVNYTGVFCDILKYSGMGLFAIGLVFSVISCVNYTVKCWSTITKNV